MDRCMYQVIYPDGSYHYFCNYERALQEFRNYGKKLYLKTKNLFPTKALLLWQ